jgi:DNA-binding response OmpR family regulator
MEEHKQRALESGCNDYDTKPVDLDRLLTKISKQLGNNND